MRLLVYGAGGFGREVYDTARRANAVHGRWTDLYFIDDAGESGRDFYGTTVHALPDAALWFKPTETEVVIATGEPAVRRTLRAKLLGHGLPLGTVIDPSAIVADTAIIQAGVIITAQCVVASAALIGENVAVNVMSIVGHDVRLAENTVVSSMVNLGGSTTVGEDSYIGMGVQIKQGLTIGRDVIVGMGSVVYDNIPDGVIALGNPARVMRKNEDKIVFR